PDGSGFFYTRYPNPGTTVLGEEFYYRHVYFHRLGTDPAQDPKIFGEGRSAHELYQLLVSPDGRHLLVHARQGWAKNELYLRDLQSSNPFIPLTQGADALYYGRILGDQLFVWTNEGASNYRVFVTSVRTPGREHWRELIPETETVIQNLELVKDRIAILGLRQASYVIQIYSRDGGLEHEAPLPTYGTVGVIDGDPECEEILFTFSSFCVSPTIYRYNVKTRALDVYEQLESQIEPDRYKVEQIWYASKDGTKVSMFIAYSKDISLNGDNPTVLTGYGGFNAGRFPLFSPAYYWWIEHGGVLALANLRGGGEFGEKWHRAGMLDQKQNAFDDFTSAAEWLIHHKYTRPERLGILGRSNGGLLVGAAMTQHPELFKAVICGVPLLDMLRYQHFLVAKLWIPEYGSSEDPEQFRWLYAYSPYHHVQKDVHYPSVLFHTAESDSRVDPMHARKVAALIQETVEGKSLVLLRLEARAGHGIGKPVSKVIDEQVDTWGFLAWQLGRQ
ncbi:S9 family peptidase, partial [Candidatus Acetothermia bacterium]|nr:S9 family peptidase [Candidatus Acetothermia bacterium]